MFCFRILFANPSLIIFGDVLHPECNFFAAHHLISKLQTLPPKRAAHHSIQSSTLDF